MMILSNHSIRGPSNLPFTEPEVAFADVGSDGKEVEKC